MSNEWDFEGSYREGALAAPLPLHTEGRDPVVGISQFSALGKQLGLSECRLQRGVLPGAQLPPPPFSLPVRHLLL